MAIYHLHGQIIKRTEGRSAVACAAYRAGVALYDERLEKCFDFTRKHEVEESIILGPVGMPDWLSDREGLWNAVEAAERVNGQPAREFDVALPIELIRKNRRAAKQLARDWAYHMFVTQELIVDISFHNMRGRNPHAHVMVTTRLLHPHACEFQAGSPEVFGKKARHLNDHSFMEVWRRNWAEYANAAMARHEIDVRIDHRSLADQNVTREPGIHVGPKANAMWEERCVERDRWTRNAIIWWENETPWFEENDRYVAFLDAEAAEERRLGQEACETIARRADLEQLADRLDAAVSKNFISAKERLDAPSDRLAVTAATNPIEGKRADLDALGARLEQAAQATLSRAEERLDHAAERSLRATKKRWYQKYHQAYWITQRFETQSRAISTTVATQRDAIARVSERHAELSQRLDTAAISSLQRLVIDLEGASGRLDQAAASALARAHDRADGVQSRLDALQARARLMLHTEARRIDFLGERMDKAVDRITESRKQALRRQVLGLERARPSRAILVAERIKDVVRPMSSAVARAGRAVATATGWLVEVAADGLIRIGRWGERVYERVYGNGADQRSPTRPEALPIEPEKTVEIDASSAAEAEFRFMLDWLRRLSEKDWLPVRRKDGQVSLDAARLPSGLRDWAASNATHAAVLDLIEREEGEREVQLIMLLGNSPEPLLMRNAQGQLMVFKDRFKPHLKDHVPEMLVSRPLLWNYTLAALARWASADADGRAVVDLPSQLTSTSKTEVSPAPAKSRQDRDDNGAGGYTAAYLNAASPRGRDGRQ